MDVGDKMKKWEMLTVYVQRDERTGAIIRLQENEPALHLVERLKRLRDNRRALEEKEKRQG